MRDKIIEAIRTTLVLGNPVSIERCADKIIEAYKPVGLMKKKLDDNISEWQLQRLYDWIMDENREPAQTAFTAGTLRNCAKEIEFRIKRGMELPDTDVGDIK